MTPGERLDQVTDVIDSFLQTHLNHGDQLVAEMEQLDTAELNELRDVAVQRQEKARAAVERAKTERTTEAQEAAEAAVAAADVALDAFLAELRERGRLSQELQARSEALDATRKELHVLREVFTQLSWTADDEEKLRRTLHQLSSDGTPERAAVAKRVIETLVEVDPWWGEGAQP
jgi:hypothetical protein